MKTLYTIATTATLLALSCSSHYLKKPDITSNTMTYTIIDFPQESNELSLEAKKTLDSLANWIYEQDSLLNISYRGAIEDTTRTEIDAGYERVKKVRKVIEDKNPKVAKKKGVRWSDITLDVVGKRSVKKVLIDIEYNKDNKTKK